MFPARLFLEGFSAAAHDRALELDEGYELFHFFDFDVLHRVVFGFRDEVNNQLIVDSCAAEGNDAAQRLLLGAMIGQHLAAPPRMRALPPHLYELRLAAGRRRDGAEHARPDRTIDLLGIRGQLRELRHELAHGDSAGVLQMLLDYGPAIFYGVELLSGRWRARLGRLLELDIHRGSPFDFAPDVVASRAFSVMSDSVADGYAGSRGGSSVNGLRDAMALAMLAEGIQVFESGEGSAPLARFYTETPRILDVWRADTGFRRLLTYRHRGDATEDGASVDHGVLRNSVYYLIRALIPELGYETVEGPEGTEANPSMLFQITSDLNEAAAALQQGGVTEDELSRFPVGQKTLGEYMSEVTEMSAYSKAWRRLINHAPRGLPEGLLRDLEDVIAGERGMAPKLDSSFEEHLRILMARTSEIAAFTDTFMAVGEAMDRFQGHVRPAGGSFRQHFGLTRWGFSSEDVEEPRLRDLAMSYEEWLEGRHTRARGGVNVSARFPAEVAQRLHSIRGAALDTDYPVGDAVAALGFMWLLDDFHAVERYGRVLMDGLGEALYGLYSNEGPADGGHARRLAHLAGAIENMVAAAEVRAIVGGARAEGLAEATAQGALVQQVERVVSELGADQRRFEASAASAALTQGYALFYAWQGLAGHGKRARAALDQSQLATRSYDICRKQLDEGGELAAEYVLVLNHCLYVALVSGCESRTSELDHLADELIGCASRMAEAWSEWFDDTLGYYFYRRAAGAIQRGREKPQETRDRARSARRDLDAAATWFARIREDVSDREVTAHRALLRQSEAEVEAWELGPTQKSRGGVLLKGSSAIKIGGTLMTVYVHAPGVTNIWHWCKNCSSYPTNPQGHRTDRPTGQLCDQCREKERNGNCRP